jgi:predicted enzyme related to lactoylglutathione lyase
MSRVVHFEFATPDPAREIEFFSSVFGWAIQNWGDEQYWLVDTGKEDIGINGAIMPQNSPEQPRVVNTIGVENLDESMAKASAAGATVAMERQEVPNIGWTAYMVSPTGILFGMIQPMPGGGM